MSLESEPAAKPAADDAIPAKVVEELHDTDPIQPPEQAIEEGTPEFDAAQYDHDEASGDAPTPPEKTGDDQL